MYVVEPSTEESDTLAQGSPSMSESDWENFPIPFEKLSVQAREDCEKGERNKNSMNEVVHVTISAVRTKKSYVPCKVFKILAKKIIRKYPKMFTDIDEDGVVMGDGSHTIFYKLMDRNNYLNRPHKKRSLMHELQISPKQRKIILSAKAG